MLMTKNGQLSFSRYEKTMRRIRTQNRQHVTILQAPSLTRCRNPPPRIHLHIMMMTTPRNPPRVGPIRIHPHPQPRFHPRPQPFPHPYKLRFPPQAQIEQGEDQGYEGRRPREIEPDDRLRDVVPLDPEYCLRTQGGSSVWFGLGGGGVELTATRFAGRKTKPRIVRVLISALSLAAALAIEAWDLLSSCAMRL
jgi:hypothetical protein